MKQLSQPGIKGFLIAFSVVWQGAVAADLPEPPQLPASVLDEYMLPLVRSVEADPGQAGSWLDLALRLCQKGEAKLADRLLNYIERAFDPPAGIREVIALMREGGCDTGRAPTAVAQPPAPRANLALQRGHDSNVNQGASNALFALGSAFPGVVVELTPEFLPKGDQFSALDGRISFGREGELQGSAQIRLKHYDALHRFDTGILFTTLEQSWRCGNARCTAGGALGAITLGSHLYQTLGNAQLGWTLPLDTLPMPQTLTLEASVVRQLFATQPAFDAWLAQARATWRVLLYGTDLVQLSLALGLDEPTNSRPGGRRTLTTLGAAGNHELGSQLALDWSLQRQLTREAQAYSPGLIDAARRPLLQSLALGLTQGFTPAQRLRLEWRYTANRDVVSLFTYRNTSISLSWLLDF